MRERVLVTGFEPFRGQTLNSSLEVVRALEGRAVSPVALETACVPVLFDAALEALRDAIHRFEPDVVIALGQADAYSQIAVEHVAVNLNSSEEPDNAGSRATDLPVVPDGPIAYWSSLPVRGIVAALHDAGIPAVVSYDAGGFVCNHLFYGLMHLLANERLDTIGGFVHLPVLPEQAVGTGVPSMGRETLVKAVEVIVSASSA